MKKLYVEAELEVVELLNADIITTSGKPGGGSDVPENEQGSWGGYY